MSFCYQTTGYFSNDLNQRPRPEPVEVTCTNQGHHYTVHFRFASARWISVPFSLLRQLAAETRAACNAEGTAERAAKIKMLTGISKGGRQRETTVNVWFRSNGIVDMVSFDLDDLGQLSVPYNKLEAAIAKDKRTLA